MIDSIVYTFIFVVILPLGILVGLLVGIPASIAAKKAQEDKKLREDNPELWLRKREIDAQQPKGGGLAGKAAATAGSILLQAVLKKATGMK